ncbi:hypothetical protein ND861_09630 [Leptospira sp. 2 VSF19]|uniref:Uncharacterized protein n=1 Tax=Leptospira soteropolitanensis TaxID=2950025 RepID=A0AAW5VNT6_9LEPT|nr:hypothetical protein [Leptospira soteropolitanensis]MCW7492534.1 hypothetical protein [Leptospira soteropolitanensis]MCW7500582.1 hypothetical protein [Leptospira soteropolitanensis]MCW7522748.1 hypothetical protein [Leptospira soteropolitanensis]MCW7526604.1 hypothetical protein [Leptospira soteropolitanensis]MCW7530552.1 hypothetical protein [Leptospira soteropolitanensis]
MSDTNEFDSDFDLDDNSEFETEIDEQNSLSISEVDLFETEFSEITRFRNYIKKAEARGMSRKQILPFRALVELDEKRVNKIGLKELFIVYCENGNKAWLNPGKGIGALESVLGKFHGDQKTLQPFIELLIEIAKSKISPAAFLKFIIIPRLKGDLNWRTWVKNHLPALKTILNVLKEVQRSQSFQDEIISNGPLKLSRDIILTKYVGGIIAKLELNRLSDLNFQKQYTNSWENLEFNNYLAFYFIKSNVLPFLSQLSKKLEAKQIIELVSEMAPLEKAFLSIYPDEIFSWKKIPKFTLYPVSFHHSYLKRLEDGYTLFQIYIELLSFTRVVRSTLPTRAGIYLVELIVRWMLRKVNPTFIQQIHKLLEILPDFGGLYTYRWHIQNFISSNETSRIAFIQQVENNDGLHPDFPKPFWLIYFFNNTNETADFHIENSITLGQNQTIEKFASRLRLNEYLDRTKVENRSISNLLEAFFHKYPEKKELIQSYQKDILNGRDRSWNRNDTKQIDSICPEFHQILLMSKIKGLRGGFRSETLEQLFYGFSAANHLPTLPYEMNFDWEETKKENKDAKGTEIIRKKINLQLFQNLFSILKLENHKLSDFLPFLGNEMITLKKSISKKKDEIANANEPSSKSKIQTTILHIENRIKHLESVHSNFQSWSYEKQIIFLIFFSSKNVDRMDNLFEMSVGNLLNSNLLPEEISIGKELLSQDIVIENLQLYQIDALILFCKNLVSSFQSNQKINSFFDNLESEFLDILKPYSSLKKQSIQLPALDSALNLLLRVGKMEAEKAKWLDQISKSFEKPKIRKYKLFSSKSFIDSYYGNMGGICLAGRPQEILRSNLFNFRITDETSGKIVGMFLVTYSTLGVKSLGIDDFFSVFAINPLYSVLYHWSKKEKLQFYLWIRSLLEFISLSSKKPIFLAGRGIHGLITEGEEFREIIESTEIQFNSKKVSDAFVLDIYYDKYAYAKSYLICDPKNPNTMHAHRLLKL